MAQTAIASLRFNGVRSVIHFPHPLLFGARAVHAQAALVRARTPVRAGWQPLRRRLLKGGLSNLTACRSVRAEPGDTQLPKITVPSAAATFVQVRAA